MENIIRIAAFFASGTWLTTHTPDQWASAFMGLIDSAETVAYTIQAKSPAFEVALTPVFHRLLSLFV